MRIEAVKRDIKQGGVMQVARATVAPSRKIFSMFEDNTYGNKPVAILRELVANGIDAHVAAGTPNRPVEVTLPTDLDPTFKVKDYGIGMSQEFVIGDPDKGIPSKFMAYSDGSTKDKDNNQIGGFGIGSKSPFSYVDQYTLRVVFDGVLSVYTMFKDDEGFPSIGLLGTTTTDEPNGVEVSFPVEAEDIQKFREAAQQALMYFRPLPLVENGSVTPPEYSYVGNNWALRKQGGELGVIMGGVRYPVATNSLDASLRHSSELSPLLNYGIDLTLPIGAVQPATSREALSYTDKTTPAIKQALLDIVADVVSTFATLFDNEPTLWAAKKKLYEETGGANRYSQSARQQLLGANAQYKGSKLTTEVEIRRLVGFKAWVIGAKRSWGRQPSLKTPKWETPEDIRLFIPGEVEQIIVDDLPQKPKSKTMIKVREFIDQQPRAKQILFLRAKDTENRAEIDQMLRNLGDPQNVVFTSTLPEPVTTVKAAKAANVRPKVRMFSSDGQRPTFYYGSWPVTNFQPGTNKPVKEIKYADQPATGTMVVMDNFNLPELFWEKMALGLVKWEDLVFVNKIDEPKLKDNFKTFDEVFDPLFKAAKKKLPAHLETMLAYDINPSLSPLFEVLGRLQRISPSFLTELSDAQLETPFGKIAVIWNTMVRPITPEHRKFLPFMKLPSVPGAKMRQEYEQEQPLLKALIGILPTHAYHRIEREHVALLVKNV